MQIGFKEVTTSSNMSNNLHGELDAKSALGTNALEDLMFHTQK